MTLVVVALVLITCVSILVGWFAFTGRRRERLRTRLLAQRLLVESRMDALTAQTLLAMRQAARQSMNPRGQQ